MLDTVPRVASAANALVQRAAMRDAGLKEAARLLLLDLEEIDANLTRSLDENSKRRLTREHLTSPRWPEYRAAFAGLFAHSEQEDWETLITLFDTDKFLDGKRIEGRGEDRPLDVREQGWVWCACALHVPLRREMNLLATTPWWRRRFHLTRRQVLAHNFRITPPPVPPAVREQMETESALEPRPSRMPDPSLNPTSRPSGAALVFRDAEDLSLAGDQPGGPSWEAFVKVPKQPSPIFATPEWISERSPGTRIPVPLSEAACDGLAVWRCHCREVRSSAVGGRS